MLPTLPHLPLTSPLSAAKAPSQLILTSSGTPTLPSRPLKLLVLGEAPGADELAAGVPFVGASGRLLRNTLFPEAGLDLDQWHHLNVFHTQPPKNNIEAYFVTKTDAKKDRLILDPLVPLYKKKHLRPEYYGQLIATDAAIRALQPDFIIALGATALWFITGDSGIGSFRGTVLTTRYGSALATYHPAAVLRQWSFKPVVWADLIKARLAIEGRLPKPVKRKFCINPTFAELAVCYATLAARPQEEIGVDIETAPSTRQITTVGFSTPSFGVCIPIWDKYEVDPKKRSFWPTVEDELKAWRWIEKFANLPNPKVLQNRNYDMQYLLDAPIEIRLRNANDDTSTMHHALQPELKKDLGMLGSLYLNEPAWKQMRTSNKDAKAEE